MSSTRASVKNGSKLATIIIVVVIGSFAIFAGFVLKSTSSSGDRPSKKDVVDKLYSFNSFAEDGTEELSREFHQCVMDIVYEKLSDETLLGIMGVKNIDDADALEASISDEESQLLFDAGDECDDDPYTNGEDEYIEPQSAAKTTLSNAILALKSLQTGNGDVDFSNITVDAMNEFEPDLTFVGQPLDADSEPFTVAVVERTDTKIVMQTRSDEDLACYFVQLNSDSQTLYGTSWIDEGESCPTAPNADYGTNFMDSIAEGWT